MLSEKGLLKINGEKILDIMNNLICQSWILYPESYKGVIRSDFNTGNKFSDIIPQAKELRVFGTKKQLEDLEDKYSIDEIYSFKVEEKGSYWYNIYNDPEAENSRVLKKLEEYKILYELNNNETLIFRTK